MFGIPGKQAVTLTPAAAAQIARLMAKQGSQGLRIGVKKGGCAGMEYTVDLVTEPVAKKAEKPAAKKAAPKKVEAVEEPKAEEAAEAVEAAEEKAE